MSGSPRDLNHQQHKSPEGSILQGQSAVTIVNMKKGRPENLKLRATNAERFHCTPASIGLNGDQHRELMDFLPKGYQYHVCSYQAVSQPSHFDHHNFTATLRMSLQSKEDIQTWMEAMPVTWRVYATRPTKGQRTIFSNVYRCQHNTRQCRHPQKPDRVSKNTLCGAQLKVSLVRTVASSGRQSRSTDPHIPAYPTMVEISNVHNHNIFSAAALRFRDVGAAAVEKLTKLFEAGHSPSSALDALKYDLQVEYGDDYVYKSADRSICPDLGYCIRLYAGTFQAGYRSRRGQDVHTDESYRAPLQSPQQSIGSPQMSEPSPGIAMDATEEDPETSAHQPVWRSAMAATEGFEVDEESVFDDDWFRSKMSNFTETVLNNKGVLDSGVKAMVKSMDTMVGHPSKLLAPAMLLSAMHAFGRSGTNHLGSSQRAQALRRVANRAGPGTAAQASSSICRRKAQLGGKRRLAAGRPKKTVNHGLQLLERSEARHSQLVPSSRGVSQQSKVK